MLEKKFFRPAVHFIGLCPLLQLNIIYQYYCIWNVHLDADGHLMLLDYSQSQMFSTADDSTSHICWPVLFTAPEALLQRRYNMESEWFSVGVLGMKMVSGLYPEIRWLKPQGTWRFEVPPQVQGAARDFFTRLLEPNPEMRLGHVGGVAELQQHPFFSGINFAAVARKVILPPIRPLIGGPDDVSHIQADHCWRPEPSMLGNLPQFSDDRFRGELGADVG